ncbi:MAG: hypothetical protein ACRD0W_22810 [Acidimicrobiales bacterium]
MPAGGKPYPSKAAKQAARKARNATPEHMAAKKKAAAARKAARGKKPAKK